MLIILVHVTRHEVSKTLILQKYFCKKNNYYILLCKVFQKIFHIYLKKISLKHFVYNNYTKMFVIVKKIILHFYIAKISFKLM